MIVCSVCSIGYARMVTGEEARVPCEKGARHQWIDSTTRMGGDVVTVPMQYEPTRVSFEAKPHEKLCQCNTCTATVAPIDQDAMPSACDVLREIAPFVEVYSKLNEDERASVMIVAQMAVERSYSGRTRYKPLNLSTDPRDFVKEALEESVDGSLYGAQDMIRSRRKDAR